MIAYSILYVFYLLPAGALASMGDVSHEFRRCYHACHYNNCSDGSLKKFYKQQKLPEYILQWSCEDECKYDCMWHATETFIDRGWDVPQFFGKWPFIKILGVQEPASVLFSFLNFYAHLHNLVNFRKRVSSNAPMYYLWHIYSVVCLNGWLWSMIFHAKDTNFTEKMDYICAFSMVTFSFLAFCFRALYSFSTKVKQYVILTIGLFFIYHTWYLSGKSFDYGYNMKINIVVGLLNGLGWLFWSWMRPDTQEHFMWCRITIAGLGVSMLLELLDFVPFFWIFDAHALWHLSTFPLSFYWYRFIIGDCLYLFKYQGHSESFKKYA